MVYEPLHHKYRPQKFADLVGQEAIATTLTNAIVSQKIAPAYLFTGPRGTGKTSSARILAKSLNCLSCDRPTPKPCGQCEVCRSIANGSALDVIEIDAASNTGVDNIREIIERAQFAPVQCRYKVYVIDECHMLSTAAFNALLKTLEEPPERIVFVLATTDLQRVLPTIISRCQKFDYRRIPLKSMVAHLQYISRSEQIDITDEAVTLVGQIANGGLRDAESLLDQLSLLSGQITIEKVWDLVGAVPEQDLLELLQAIAKDNVELVLHKCRHLLDRGREPLAVLQSLAGFYLNLLIAKTAPDRSDLVALTDSTWSKLCLEANHWKQNLILQGQQHLKDSELQLKNTTQPRLWLEITLLGLLPSAIACEPSVKEIRASSNRVETRTNKRNDHVDVEPKSSHTNLETANISVDRVPTQPVSSPPVPSTSIEVAPISQVEKTPIQSPSISVASIASDRQDKTSPDISSASQNIDRADLWRQIIDSVKSPMTQTLLRQHCHLLSFTGTHAQVGISSPQLLKLNQNKLPNIEAAFTQVLGQKIKVSFELASSQQSQTVSSRTETLDKKEYQTKTISRPIEPLSSPEKVSEHHQSEPPPHPIVEKNINDRVTPVKPNALCLDSIDDKKIESETIVQSESTPNLEINLHSDRNSSITEFALEISEENLSEEQVKKAAESLAKCFEGETIVIANRSKIEKIIDSEKDEPTESIAPLNKTNSQSKDSQNLLDQEQNKIIRGRPDLSNLDEDEDIPF